MFLPNAHTDFIFAIIGEELGLVGCLLVLALFAGFGLVGFHVARSARPTGSAMLLAAGVTTWVVGQAAINLGAVVGLLPVSGITLPFLSAGGSSLVFTMVGAGMLANVARQSPRAAARRRREPRRGGPVSESTRSRCSPAAAPADTSIPAIALAQELVARGPRPGVDPVRRRPARDSRAASCPTRASRSTCLPGRGLQRRLTLANIGVVRRDARSRSSRAFGIVRRYRPRVVVGFGGYASLPCVVAARFWRVPAIVHEQDAVIGLANRIGVRLGARVAASLPGVDAARRRCSPATRCAPSSATSCGTGQDAAAGRRVRRRAGRAHDQPRHARAATTAGATAPTSPCTT